MYQSINPILPLSEYIPDGEPHVFGDRIYLFGSHDREGGDKYCDHGDYVGWSAPLSDPSKWECAGVIYSPEQDPNFTSSDNDKLYAPDVMQGNDGRYYLYYCFGGSAGHSRIGVAVCDEPNGRYEYYGQVQNRDGSVCRDYLMGDPGVINDDGVPRLYCGWSLSMVAAGAHHRGNQQAKESQQAAASGRSARAPQLPAPGDPEMNVKMAPIYQMLFHRSPEEVKDLAYPLMGANTYELEDDMITVKNGPYRIVPGQFDTPKESSFYGHAFYEASSIRKINGLYYFIYSSENSNELCYAVSKHPNRDFVYGGTIISNGDVGYCGRTGENRTNQTANDHGSLECINGQWYIFHHRQTHKCTFDRQACVERVTIREDGSIPQVECTSLGFTDTAHKAEGTFPAVMSCVLTNGSMPHITNTATDADIPNITNDSEERFITAIKNGTTVGYKYFAFTGRETLTLKYRGFDAEGTMHLYTVRKGEVITAENEIPGKAQFTADLSVSDREGMWKSASTNIEAEGTGALYLVYEGKGSLDLLELSFG